MNSQDPLSARPRPIFLGYCLKQRPGSPGWLEDPRVRDLASVTTCNQPRPEGWIDRWDFNEAGYYDTPEQAEAALGDVEERRAFHLFAYEFFPLRFGARGDAVPVDCHTVFGPEFHDSVSGMPAPGFEFLGYDAVERWAEPEPGRIVANALGGGFGCSPLFCNRCSREYPINPHCLLTEWADAVRAARRFGIEQPEPGCYYVFGVWARIPDGGSLHSDSSSRPASDEHSCPTASPPSL